MIQNILTNFFHGCKLNSSNSPEFRRGNLDIKKAKPSLETAKDFLFFN